eukprot:TRINITY_DN36597_c0_g1_i1.p1 TRINITY_DN36597_c0_g1~~TRINITY_DN36597_c0_g1_i1.p1  ORF type:complete len:397 (+),score=126.25 TRINITY_DN36597_c0_g1_i1:115-1305(+)
MSSGGGGGSSGGGGGGEASKDAKADPLPLQPPSTHSPSGGLLLGPVLPQLSLPPFAATLDFGQALGKGASGSMVFRCTAKLKGDDADVNRSSEKADGAVPDESSQKIVCAAKVLPLGKATFPDMVEEFGREVELMKSLQHASLATFVGALRIPRSPMPEATEAYVLCVELCDGELEAVLKQRRRQQQSSGGSCFAQEDIGRCLAQVAAGLEYMHCKRLLHRDLKAANVFLKKPPQESLGVLELPLRRLQAKIGDFGACSVSSRANTPVQTPRWMAPEVARLEPYGRPADIWAFGALIFETLELGPPYGEDITLDQLEKTLTASTPPSLSDESATEARCPDVVSLMRECFKANPAERPTATAIVEKLRAAGFDWKGEAEPLSPQAGALPGQAATQCR